jgi:hypothetical protein
MRAIYYQEVGKMHSALYYPLAKNIKRGRVKTILAAFAVFLIMCGTASADFTDNTDGTVSDISTNLMWQQQDDGTARTWADGLTYCKGLSLGGHTDWRLPNIKELKSIADMTKYNPAIDTTYFLNTASAYYWSSTTYVLDRLYTYAWQVGFSDGSTDHNYSKIELLNVRCVR